MAGIRYKLNYFPLRGRGEYIRLVFALTGIPCEDNRIPMQDWPKIKPTIPGGRLPMLEVNSGIETEYYVESMAIARWVAKRNGLMGKTDEEYYKIERIIGQAEDAEKEFFKSIMKSEEEKKEILKDSMTRLPGILNLICESLRNSGGKFVTGDQISFGDLYLIHVMDHMNDFDPSILEGKYPEIKKHREDLLDASPKLKTYLEARPPMPF